MEIGGHNCCLKNGVYCELMHLHGLYFQVVTQFVAYRPYQPQCHKLKKRIFEKVLYEKPQ